MTVEDGALFHGFGAETLDEIVAIGGEERDGLFLHVGERPVEVEDDAVEIHHRAGESMGLGPGSRNGLSP